MDVTATQAPPAATAPAIAVCAGRPDGLGPPKTAECGQGALGDDGGPDHRAMAPLTFDEVLARHQAEVYRFAVHLTRNPTDADDLYQETLLKAFRAFGRLKGDPNHRAWLYRIATNAFLDDRRRHGRVGLLDEATERTLPAAPTDQAAKLDARDLLREVEAFIAGLPPKQRVALLLRKHQEASYAEIALTLRCSEPAARASVHEALRKLRDAFGDRL